MTEPNVKTVIVAGNGTLYVAPVGTTAPDQWDVDDTLDAAFKPLGYVTEDGLAWSNGVEAAEIMAWQSTYAIRRLVTKRTSTFAFGLMEFTPVTVGFALGGGTVTGGSGGYNFAPSAAGTVDERAMVYDYVDGTTKCRIYVPKGMVAENVDTSFRRTEAAVLPITFAATPAAGDDPYWFITDSPSWSDYTL